MDFWSSKTNFFIFPREALPSHWEEKPDVSKVVEYVEVKLEGGKRRVIAYFPGEN